MGVGCEWRHARKRWAEIFGDFEKDVSWDPTLGQASPAGGYGMRSVFVGSDRTVSIVKIVSLSPRIEKLKSRS